MVIIALQLVGVCNSGRVQLIICCHGIAEHCSFFKFADREKTELQQAFAASSKFHHVVYLEFSLCVFSQVLNSFS